MEVESPPTVRCFRPASEIMKFFRKIPSGESSNSQADSKNNLLRELRKGEEEKGPAEEGDRVPAGHTAEDEATASNQPATQNEEPPQLVLEKQDSRISRTASMGGQNVLVPEDRLRNELRAFFRRVDRGVKPTILAYAIRRDRKGMGGQRDVVITFGCARTDS